VEGDNNGCTHGRQPGWWMSRSCCRESQESRVQVQRNSMCPHKFRTSRLALHSGQSPRVG
jgi:hypothetical protein